MRRAGEKCISHDARLGDFAMSMPGEHAARRAETMLRTLATDIRALRRARGLTLAELSRRLKRSIGWLSQIERGLSVPTMADLRAMAETFSVPLSLLFPEPPQQEGEEGIVVRAGRRRSLSLKEAGRLEELLCPDLAGSFQMLHTVVLPGAQQREPARRSAEEAGFLIAGRFEIEVDGIWHRLEPGDSFRVKGKPFSWRNPGDENAVLLWVAAPPRY
jgi:transcriptional regulator with XRE-family HTH domain